MEDGVAGGEARAGEQTLVYPHGHQRAAARWGVDRTPQLSMTPVSK
ncbi:MAG: hypothetical protein WAL75_02715 [Terracidiphilus sp.]